MKPLRSLRFKELFPKEPAFRWKQVEEALFQPQFHAWEEVSSLPKALRECLQKELPWMSFKNSEVFHSKKGDTHKAMLTLEDDQKVETVLMENRRGQWTICVSSQVGCAMGCTFCATGKMGLLRSMTADEIMDQYRFWTDYLEQRPELPQRISNVVFMGMGEPLANYDNVKATLQTWLKYTDLGPTHITVSTVGLIPVLENLLKDPDWPAVRLAISLHSADPVTRKEIVPSSYDGFLEKLEDWTFRYLEKFTGRRQHLTFEYVMLQNVNDTPDHAAKLAQLAQRVGRVKINLIPYNFTDLGFQRSIHERTAIFKELLEESGLTVTVRKTMGDDIAAACGQLITIKKS